MDEEEVEKEVIEKGRKKCNSNESNMKSRILWINEIEVKKD